MGINTENLFVHGVTSDVVLAAVEEYLQRPFDPSRTHADWPLELTFHPSMVTRGRKVSVSDASDGWVAVVESSETVEPGLAEHLHQALAAQIVVAQLYEVTASCGFAVWNQGAAFGGPTRHDVDDALGAVIDALKKAGVPFRPLLFRETVGRTAAGWRTVPQSIRPR